jgi:hypothetical protein
MLLILGPEITQITHAGDVKKLVRGSKHSIVSPSQHECSMCEWEGRLALE